MCGFPIRACHLIAGEDKALAVLLITNGDSAAELLRAAELGDVVLPWRDCLCEGPVPSGLDRDALWAVRTDYLARQFGQDPKVIAQDFEDRHALLTGHDAFERIELWFEHDLYDQLQLIECLCTLSDLGAMEKTTIVQSPTFLTMKTPETIGALKDLQIRVAPATLASARAAWSAVRSSDPHDLEAIHKGEITDLMFLRPALKRLLQDYPGPDGLSRTERQIVYSINRGIGRVGMLFARALAMEEAAFLGDFSFFTILSNLQTASVPLIDGLSEIFTPSLMDDGERRKSFITSTVHLTDMGKAVLSGTRDALDLNGINRWIGGVHLTDITCPRWDEEAEHLVFHETQLQ